LENPIVRRIDLPARTRQPMMPLAHLPRKGPTLGSLTSQIGNGTRERLLHI
jgi:hypothetical protein